MLILPLALVFIQKVHCASLNDIPYLTHFEPLDYAAPRVMEHQRSRRDKTISHQPIIELDLHVYNRDFNLRLSIDTGVLDKDAVIVGVPEFNRDVIVSGYLDGETNSRAHGFLIDGVFEGHVYTNDDKVYYFERANNYFSNISYHSFVYESSDVHIPDTKEAPRCGHGEHGNEWLTNHQQAFKRGSYDTSNEPFVSLIRNRRAVLSGKDLSNMTSCSVELYADWTFVKKMQSKDRAISAMVDFIVAVNEIYSKTDFDGDGQPEGINFKITRAQAVSQADEEYAALKYPFFEPMIGVEALLKLWSEYTKTDACLAVLFSHRDFDNGVLGLAWVGDGMSSGPCGPTQRTNDRNINLNTAVVTSLNYQRTMPNKVVEITVAHEFGHVFGAQHDTTSDSVCSPGDNNGGNFIMFPSSTSGDGRNNRVFSPCSRSSMWKVIQKAASKCFKQKTGPMCGNSLVEDGEQCDCGYITDCQKKKDTCCNPADQPDGCRLVAGVMCSPSQGQCCTENCSFQPTTKICANATDCAQATNCSGTSAVCPNSKPNNELQFCNIQNGLVCQNGSCSGSVCLQKGLTNCMCSEPENQCMVCCRTSNVTCLPTSSIPGISKSYNLVAGSSCNKYAGYCDVFQKCRSVDPDGVLARLKKLLTVETFKDIFLWMKQYWYYTLLGGIGLILLMAAFIKVCSVHTPTNSPNLPPARTLSLSRTLSRRSRTRNSVQHASTSAGPSSSSGHNRRNPDGLPTYDTVIRNGGGTSQAMELGRHQRAKI